MSCKNKSRTGYIILENVVKIFEAHFRFQYIKLEHNFNARHFSSHSIYLRNEMYVDTIRKCEYSVQAEVNAFYKNIYRIYIHKTCIE